MGTFYPFLSGRDNLRAGSAIPSRAGRPVTTPTEGLKFSGIVARKARWAIPWADRQSNRSG